MAFLLFGIGSGGDSEEMKQADLTSQVDSNRTSFTVPEEYSAGSLRVYYNGVRQTEGNTFNEHNSTTFTTNFTPITGDYLTIDYSPNTT